MENRDKKSPSMVAFDFSEIEIPAHRSESEILNELEAICTSTGYPHALSFICWRDNFFGFEGDLDPDDLQKSETPERLLRTEISLITRLMASADINLAFTDPASIQKSIDETERLLSELHHAMNVQFIRALKNTGPDFRDSGTEARALSLREPIFYAAESAFHFQYRDFSTLRYQSDAAWLKDNVGFSSDEVVRFYDSIIELQLQRLTEIRANTTHENLGALTLLPAFTARSDEVAAVSGLHTETVECIVQAFSPDTIPVMQRYREIGAWNELSSRPIIKIDEGSFMLFQGYCLAESAYESPFYWMQADRRYRNRASDNRGRFTEDFAASCLRNVFNPEHIHQNVLVYSETGETVGEIDVLVLYADRAVVIQAKSKRLTEAARKGVTDALKSDLEKAVQAAYDQGYQCAEFLKTNNHRFIGSDRNEIEINDSLNEIFLVCLVSDHFPGLSYYADDFITLNDHPDIREPYIIDIFLLDVICEILDSPLYFFSFLNRRHTYAQRIRSSSEISILGYHLKYNLYFEDEMDFINLGDDFTTQIDAAMLARRADLPAQRTPDGILTRHRGTIFGNLIDQLTQLEENNVLDLGYFLLMISENAARDISDAILHISAKAQADHRVHDFSMAFAKAGITVHCGWQDNQETYERLHAHCELSKYRTKADSWYGIALRPFPIGSVRLVLGLKSLWKREPELDQAVAQFGNKPIRKNLRQAIAAESRRAKIGVNQPCPCGSGKKFKKCCKEKGIY